jgi:molybdopterin converting factor small subunit
VACGTFAAYSHTPAPVYGEEVTQTTVTVRYFAAAADAAGRDEETIALDDPTVSALRTLLAERYGDPMERVMRSGSFLVDAVVSRDPSRAIRATVDVLPPFAGG